MKRIFALIFIGLMLLPALACAQSLGQGTSRVFDQAELMTAQEVQSLESLIAKLRREYGMDIAVLTSKDAPVNRSQAYADGFYDKNGLGMGTDGSGMLLLIDMKNRVPTISTKGLMIRYLTDARLDALLDTADPYLQQGAFGQAASQVIKQVGVFLKNGIPLGQYNAEEKGKSVTPVKVVLAALIGLACGLALFVAVRWKYGLKGAAYRYDYQGNSTVTITGGTDVYLRTQVTKVPKASGKSGGSGFSGGRSTIHRSSGGSIHGGRSGRRF